VDDGHRVGRRHRQERREGRHERRLRKAVEQGVGVFINSKTKTRDYKVVYDKILAESVGYVKESKVDKVVTDSEKTTVTVTALVSTKKFEKDWESIVHTVREKDNPACS